MSSNISPTNVFSIEKIDKMVIPDILQSDVFNYKYESLYIILYNESTLRNKILKFYKSLVRMNNIDQFTRKDCAYKIPWKCELPCISCNNMVKLLNYTKINSSYFRFLYNLTFKVKTNISFGKYKINHRGQCCACNTHIITDSNIKSLVCSYINYNTRLSIIYTYGNINTWDVSRVTDMSFLFSNCNKLYKEVFNEPLDKWNISNVKNMSNMFNGCSSYNQSLQNWNVSNVSIYNSFAVDTLICNSSQLPKGFDIDIACK